ncbi:MAG: SCP2 sterol-binding domain-containing protein [Rhodoferax sp.]|jgi:predicted lipid carrier protein YhbT|nr:SCP2 sterol-binding domain-containing protein [Rhodoferax sp.]MCW5627661.1 SCP2 sterol-binding domain-containing protein [Rhodoferax sp.]
MKPSPSLLLPGPVGALLARLPAYPGSVLLAGLLNRLLLPRLPADVPELLANRTLRIDVSDARLRFDFSCVNRRFVAVAAAGTSDLTIRASAHDFLRLAQRQEDPDTLFFARRLSMQGDTELGLIVKNTLDALETPVFDLRQWTPQAVLARFAPAPARGAGPRHTGSR